MLAGARVSSRRRHIVEIRQPKSGCLLFAQQSYMTSTVSRAIAGRFDWTSLKFGDRSVWYFTPNPNNANHYLLTKISNALNQSIYINYNASQGNRLTSITNDQAQTLLSFSYDGSGTLSAVSDIAAPSSAFHRKVKYEFTINRPIPQ